MKSIASTTLDNISQLSFDGKYAALKVLALSDLVTGEGFEAFSTNLEPNRQEAILWLMFDQSVIAHQALSEISDIVKAARKAGGAQ